MPVLLLLLPQIGANRPQVIVKPFCILLTYSPDLFNDGICVHN